MKNEQQRSLDSKVLADYAKIQERARKVFDESLDFIDELPDPPNRSDIQFPYGREKARPWGWDSSVFGKKPS